MCPFLERALPAVCPFPGIAAGGWLAILVVVAMAVALAAAEPAPAAGGTTCEGGRIVGRFGQPRHSWRSSPGRWLACWGN